MLVQGHLRLSPTWTSQGCQVQVCHPSHLQALVELFREPLDYLFLVVTERIQSDLFWAHPDPGRVRSVWTPHLLDYHP